MNSILCPACGHKLKYATEQAGKRAKCPRCGERFVLPPSTESTSTVLPSKSEKSQQSLQSAETASQPRSQSATEKVCTRCGKHCALAQSYCPQCGSELPAVPLTLPLRSEAKQKIGKPLYHGTGEMNAAQGVLLIALIVSALAGGIAYMTGVLWAFYPCCALGSVVLLLLVHSTQFPVVYDRISVWIKSEVTAEIYGGSLLYLLFMLAGIMAAVNPSGKDEPFVKWIGVSIIFFSVVGIVSVIFRRRKAGQFADIASGLGAFAGAIAGVALALQHAGSIFQGFLLGAIFGLTVFRPFGWLIGFFFDLMRQSPHGVESEKAEKVEE